MLKMTKNLVFETIFHNKSEQGVCSIEVSGLVLDYPRYTCKETLFINFTWQNTS